MTPAQQRAYGRDLNARQDALMAQLRTLGAVERARLTKALNAVVVLISPTQLETVAGLTNVVSVRPVPSYQLSLSETVPYIGATALQNLGVDGTGVRVAVLDTGIDYTHKNLGGPGTLAAYDAAYGISPLDPLNKTRDGLFPTAKVIGGFDFVGELWPRSATDIQLNPDPDPIDFNGHGTHVSDIIAGQSLDGTHKGVAPGAKLYAVKVCSTLASACNGVALLQAMDFALDPNNDGDLSDAVDVINMSLGSSYGQVQDDLSAASANAVRAGVVVVCAAGNEGDKPYIVGSPSTTPEVISVAQTQVPGAKGFPLQVNSPASIAGSYPNTETVGWAPIGAGFTGNVIYVGRGCPENSYSNLNVAGKVVLIDRGVCAVSLKVDRAAKAGAIGVLIGLVAPGDPISFSFGGGDTFAPTLILTQADANRLKTALSGGAAVNVTVSPANAVPLVGSMVAGSARGPSYSFNAIKPDIGAPGATVSAEVGTGDGETAFGGTSGASPIVAGSAALLIQAFPNRTPFEIKSLLMNTAETNISISPATQPGVLAPVTRIGGGEVRVNRAYGSTSAAWDKDALTGSLSFGYLTATKPAVLKKTVIVKNYSNAPRRFTIAPGFRYAGDAASGAVTVSAPPSINVPPRNDREFEVTLTIDPTKLPIWTLNGGSLGGRGSLLQGVEFDGYLTLADASESLHLAWQVLPHRAADIKAGPDMVDLRSGNANLKLKNEGAVDGRVEVFSLTGTSGAVKKKFLPGPGDNFAVVDLRAVGVRQAGEDLEFAINTFGERAHPNYPAEFDIYLDVNRDGTNDFVIFNAELSGFGASGQNAVFVLDLNAGGVTAIGFTDADLNSANVIYSVPLDAVGLTPAAKFDFSVYAFDNYFTGNLTDALENMTYTAATPRFSGSGVPATGVPAGGSSTLNIHAVPGGDAASPSQSGLLLLYRDGKLKNEADTINIVP